MPMNAPNTLCQWIQQRRWLVLAMASFPLSACLTHETTTRKTPPQPPLSPAEEALRRRFKGVYVGERRVDAMFRVYTVSIFTEKGYLFSADSFAGPKATKFTNSGNSGDGDGLPVPVALRMMRYAEGTRGGYYDRKFAYFDGTPLVDVTVQVADRIPDEVLEAVRQKRGSLRLKLRIHPETLLVGWDLETRIGAYEMAGGDFKEARIYGGKVVEKGWYIHPKTGQRIETDF